MCELDVSYVFSGFSPYSWVYSFMSVISPVSTPSSLPSSVILYTIFLSSARRYSLLLIQLWRLLSTILIPQGQVDLNQHIPRPAQPPYIVIPYVTSIPGPAIVTPSVTHSLYCSI